MTWIATNKDVLAILIAAGSLVVSLVALIRSSKMASLTAQFKRSSIIEELQDKVSPGSKAMSDIWKQWGPIAAKQVESLSQTDEEQFIEFYNRDYHGSPDENNLALSDLVHIYLRELHHTWDRIESGEFDEKAVMQRLGYGISENKQFIKLYLKAHWQAHDQLRKKEEDRFWCNFPKIVKAAESSRSS